MYTVDYWEMFWVAVAGFLAIRHAAQIFSALFGGAVAISYAIYLSHNQIKQRSIIKGIFWILVSQFIVIEWLPYNSIEA